MGVGSPRKSVQKPDPNYSPRRSPRKSVSSKQQATCNQQKVCDFQQRSQHSAIDNSVKDVQKSPQKLGCLTDKTLRARSPKPSTPTKRVIDDNKNSLGQPQNKNGDDSNCKDMNVDSVLDFEEQINKEQNAHSKENVSVPVKSDSLNSRSPAKGRRTVLGDITDRSLKKSEQSLSVADDDGQSQGQDACWKEKPEAGTVNGTSDLRVDCTDGHMVCDEKNKEKGVKSKPLNDKPKAGVDIQQDNSGDIVEIEISDSCPRQMKTSCSKVTSEITPESRKDSKTYEKRPVEKKSKSSRFWSYVAVPFEDEDKNHASEHQNKELRNLKEGTGDWFMQDSIKLESRRSKVNTDATDKLDKGKLAKDNNNIENTEDTLKGTADQAGMLEDSFTKKMNRNEPGLSVKTKGKKDDRVLSEFDSGMCVTECDNSVIHKREKINDQKTVSDRKQKGNRYWEYVVETVESDDSEDMSNESIPKELRELKKDLLKWYNDTNDSRRSRYSVGSTENSQECVQSDKAKHTGTMERKEQKSLFDDTKSTINDVNEEAGGKKVIERFKEKVKKDKSNKICKKRKEGKFWCYVEEPCNTGENVDKSLPKEIRRLQDVPEMFSNCNDSQNLKRVSRSKASEKEERFFRELCKGKDKTQDKQKVECKTDEIVNKTCVYSDKAKIARQSFSKLIEKSKETGTKECRVNDFETCISSTISSENCSLQVIEPEIVKERRQSKDRVRDNTCVGVSDAGNNGGKENAFVNLSQDTCKKPSQKTVQKNDTVMLNSDVHSDIIMFNENGEMVFAKTLADRIKERSIRRSSFTSYNIENLSQNSLRSRSNSLSSNNHSASEMDQKNSNTKTGRNKTRSQSKLLSSPGHLKSMTKQKSGASIASAKVVNKYKVQRQNVLRNECLQNGYQADDENEMEANVGRKSRSRLRICQNVVQKKLNSNEKRCKKFWYYEPAVESPEKNADDDRSLPRELRELQKSLPLVKSDCSYTEGRVSRSKVKHRKTWTGDQKAENGKCSSEVNVDDLGKRPGDINKCLLGQKNGCESRVIPNEKTSGINEKQKNNEILCESVDEVGSLKLIQDSSHLKVDTGGVKEGKPKSRKRKIFWEYEVITEDDSKTEKNDNLPKELQSLKCPWNDLSAIDLKQNPRKHKLGDYNGESFETETQSETVQKQDFNKSGTESDHVNMSDTQEWKEVNKVHQNRRQRKVFWEYVTATDEESGTDNDDRSLPRELRSLKHPWNSVSMDNLIGRQRRPNQSDVSFEKGSLGRNKIEKSDKEQVEKDVETLSKVHDTNNDSLPETSSKGQIRKKRVFWEYEVVTDESSGSDTEIEQLPKELQMLKCKWNNLSSIDSYRPRSRTCTSYAASDSDSAKRARSTSLETKLLEKSLKTNSFNNKLTKDSQKNPVEKRTLFQHRENTLRTNTVSNDKAKEEVSRCSEGSERGRPKSRKRRIFWEYEVVDDGRAESNAVDEDLPKELRELKCQWNRLNAVEGKRQRSRSNRNYETADSDSSINSRSASLDSKQLERMIKQNDKNTPLCDTIEVSGIDKSKTSSNSQNMKDPSTEEKIAQTMDKTSSVGKTTNLSESDSQPSKTNVKRKRVYWEYKVVKTDESESDTETEYLPKELQLLKCTWNKLGSLGTDRRRSRSCGNNTASETDSIGRSEVTVNEKENQKTRISKDKKKTKEQSEWIPTDKVCTFKHTGSNSPLKDSSKMKTLKGCNRGSKSPVFKSHARDNRHSRSLSPVFNRSPYFEKMRSMNKDCEENETEIVKDDCHVACKSDGGQTRTPEKCGQKIVYSSGYVNSPRGAERRKQMKRKNCDEYVDSTHRERKRTKMDGKTDREDIGAMSGVSPRKRHVKQNLERSFERRNENVPCESSKGFGSCAMKVPDKDKNYSLTWEPIGEEKKSSKGETIKLNKSWTLLSDRSVSKLLSSDDNRESFHGFDEDADSSLPSDLSYKEYSEIEVQQSDPEHDWIIEDKASETGEVFDKFVPSSFLSPAKDSNSSWIDACDGYIDRSLKQGTEVSFRNSSMYYSVMSPRKSPALQRGCNRSPGKRVTPQKLNDHGTPVKEKFESVPEIEQVDDDISFNFSSPQKRCVEFSPLRNVNGRVQGDTSPIIAKLTSTPVTLSRKTRLKEK